MHAATATEALAGWCQQQFPGATDLRAQVATGAAQLVREGSRILASALADVYAVRAKHLARFTTEHARQLRRSTRFLVNGTSGIGAGGLGLDLTRIRPSSQPNRADAVRG